MTIVTEKAKRLTPKSKTLREMFLESGNLCAFPECGALMMDAEGTFIGQVYATRRITLDDEAKQPTGKRALL